MEMSLPITDPVPTGDTRLQKVLRKIYIKSDSAGTLPLPSAKKIQMLGKQLQRARDAGLHKDIKSACQGIVESLSHFYSVSSPRLVIKNTPRPYDEEIIAEKHGDYQGSNKRIRIWMLTAKREQVISYRIMLNTLLHEFCHHLDVCGFGLLGSPHTRGFYERCDRLYRRVLGQRYVPLVWMPTEDGRFYRDINATRMKREGQRKNKKK
jgi:hypothetical protein